MRTATRQAMRCLARILCSVRRSRRRSRAPERDAAALFVRHARRRRADGADAGAILSLRRSNRCDRRSAAMVHCRRGREYPSSFSALHPRYERAVTEARPRRVGAESAGLGRAAKVARSQFHRRCRGGGPAGTVTRGDRGGFARCLAGRMGRLRPRRAGLSEARRRVIDWIADMARALDRRLMVRLVKGAYWDTEVKRAQERGLAGLSGIHAQGDDRPVLSRLRRNLLAARPRLYPQFATHNALTVACIIEDAGGIDGLRISAPARHGRGAL